MAHPNKLLIVQFPYDTSRTPQENLAFRHELEDVLDAALRRNQSGMVDGGEIGPGGINIWIYLTAWKHGVPVVEAYLKHRKLLSSAIIAKKEKKWKVVWPRNHVQPFACSGQVPSKQSPNRSGG